MVRAAGLPSLPRDPCSPRLHRAQRKLNPFGRDRPDGQVLDTLESRGHRRGHERILAHGKVHVRLTARDIGEYLAAEAHLLHVLKSLARTLQVEEDAGNDDAGPRGSRG